MLLESTISTIAAVFTTVSFLPQAIKTIKNKDTKSISLLMYIFFTIGVFFWGIFGVLINNYPTVIANALIFINASIILSIKLKNFLNGNDR